MGDNKVRPAGAVTIPVIHALVWLAVTAGTAPIPVLAGELPADLPAAPAPDEGPQEVMTRLSLALFAALGTESTAARHDADRIVPLIDRVLAPHFDPEYAARLVMGVHWSGATPEQRRQFATALYWRLLRTYADAVGSWTSERVRVLPWAGDAAALQVLVRTRVTSADGAVASVDYRLRQSAEGWKIFDVVVDGISYVRTYHADTDEEVARRGLDAAIARLATAQSGATRSTRLPDSKRTP